MCSRSDDAAMTAYVIAQISIHDRARYDRYVAGFMPILIKYGGRLLAADEAPEILQGSWERDKIIVMAFADAAGARRWMNSDEYRDISRDRVAATDGVVLLVNGLTTDVA
jgi:uncharacterized protein (DUF1330 family)